MNMNKLLLIIFALIILLYPGSAEAHTISRTCRCTFENGEIRCTVNNCSAEIMQRTMSEACPAANTATNLQFSCGGAAVVGGRGGVAGSDPYSACQNYRNNGGRANSMVVRVTADCGAEFAGANFCTEAAATVRFIGFFLFFIRILVPFIIIFMGTLDYYKAVVGNKGDEMKKQTSVLAKRILAGIIIFFIPSILGVTFLFISNWGTVEAEYDQCVTCLLNPWECDAPSPVPGR